MADDGAGGWNDNPPNDGGGEVADDGAGREVADDGAGGEVVDDGVGGWNDNPQNDGDREVVDDGACGEVVDDSATIGLFVLGFFIYLFTFFFYGRWKKREG